MISMMYLFLTALLALNVSAEILNAFIKIDESIKKSTESVIDKSEGAYSKFEAVLKENPSIEPVYKQALELKKKTDEMDSLIQGYKQKLVVAADGAEGNVNDIQKKDDNNVGGQVMILEGGGEVLKKAYDEHKAFLIGIIKDTSTIIAHNINRALSTEDIINEANEKVPWANANFEHLPLIAVIAMMSKMQNDVRNLESDILSYLLSKIGETDFKFNKIMAIVNAPNSYVLAGEEFKAYVFIGAADTTKVPDIFLEDGTKLPIDSNGRGVFTVRQGVGTHAWGGNIVLKQPGTGNEIKYPFSSEFQVVAPSVAIAATKMNVFYIGVDNPVAITAAGVTTGVNASISGGSISPTGNGQYKVRVSTPGEVTVSVSGGGRNLGSQRFRCLPLPSPYATVAGRVGGSIPATELMNTQSVVAKLDNFVFDLSFPIVSFVVSATIQGFTQEYSTTGSTISAQQKGLIRDLKRGDKVYFENIMCKMPDGSNRPLGTVAFKLQ